MIARKQEDFYYELLLPNYAGSLRGRYRYQLFLERYAAKKNAYQILIIADKNTITQREKVV